MPIKSQVKSILLSVGFHKREDYFLQKKKTLLERCVQRQTDNLNYISRSNALVSVRFKVQKTQGKEIIECLTLAHFVLSIATLRFFVWLCILQWNGADRPPLPPPFFFSPSYTPTFSYFIHQYIAPPPSL